MNIKQGQLVSAIRDVYLSSVNDDDELINSLQMNKNVFKTETRCFVVSIKDITPTDRELNIYKMILLIDNKLWESEFFAQTLKYCFQEL